VRRGSGGLSSDADLGSSGGARSGGYSGGAAGRRRSECGARETATGGAAVAADLRRRFANASLRVATPAVQGLRGGHPDMAVVTSRLTLSAGWRLVLADQGITHLLHDAIKLGSHGCR
jgi:hypothetical protein